MATIRKATVDDAEVLFKLLQDLVAYHESPDDLHTTSKQLRRAMERGIAGAFLLELEGTAIGMVIFSFAYSTWAGEYLNMEDIFVLQEYRRGGYGKKLWRAMAQYAEDVGSPKLEWRVHRDNSNAIKFYKTMPVEDVSTDGGWLTYKMRPEGIRQLARAQ